MQATKKFWYYAIILNGIILMLFTSCKKDDDNNNNGLQNLPCPGTPTVTDNDSIVYNTVLIGKQCWMKENLKLLPSVSPSMDGSNTTPHYYVYDYQGSSVDAAKATANYQTYGVLYNWPAAMSACPKGWHLPSDSEMAVLMDYLGGSSVAGGKMKTIGTSLWISPNTDATNSSGFSGLPGGYRFTNGMFYDVGHYGSFWISTDYSPTVAYSRLLYNNNASVGTGSDRKSYGFSVRCVMD